VFFVEFVKRDGNRKMHIYIRFGHVSQELSHDIKANYMHSVNYFFQQAGYKIDLFEIAFVLTAKNLSSFVLLPVGTVKGEFFLKDYCV
jgi:hypothetical protein